MSQERIQKRNRSQKKISIEVIRRRGRRIRIEGERKNEKPY